MQKGVKIMDCFRKELNKECTFIRFNRLNLGLNLYKKNASKQNNISATHIQSKGQIRKPTQNEDRNAEFNYPKQIPCKLLSNIACDSVYANEFETKFTLKLTMNVQQLNACRHENQTRLALT